MDNKRQEKPEEEKGTLNHYLESCELVTARLIESISRTCQLASTATPEMQALFEQWLNCIGSAVLDQVDENPSVDVRETAQRIGISPESLVSLLLYLDRQGKISIDKIEATRKNGDDREICSCLKP